MAEYRAHVALAAPASLILGQIRQVVFRPLTANPHRALDYPVGLRGCYPQDKAAGGLSGRTAGGVAACKSTLSPGGRAFACFTPIAVPSAVGSSARPLCQTSARHEWRKSGSTPVLVGG